MAYGWAVALGTLCSILAALASLMLWFLAAFQWENRTEGTSDDWVIMVALVLAVCAAGIFVGVLTARAWLVASGLVLGAVVSLPALRYVLEDWSEHGDTEVIAFAVTTFLAGFLALVLTAKAARELAVTDEMTQ